jgi:hypothetical protein
MDEGPHTEQIDADDDVRKADASSRDKMTLTTILVQKNIGTRGIELC